MKEVPGRKAGMRSGKEDEGGPFSFYPFPRDARESYDR
jgi:hypothetical protein